LVIVAIETFNLIAISFWVIFKLFEIYVDQYT
jgi:hypothetical protein